MTKDNANLCTLEHEARTARRGLWSLPKNQRIAPWEWRRRKNLDAFTDYSTETVVFEPAFHNKAAIGRILHSLNMLRGAVAHSCAMSADEVERLGVAVKDWFRQLK